MLSPAGDWPTAAPDLPRGVVSCLELVNAGLQRGQGAGTPFIREHRLAAPSSRGCRDAVVPVAAALRLPRGEAANAGLITPL